jgi:hypothetical protein
VASGLVGPAHHERIGPALWLFLWMIDKSTSVQAAPDGETVEGLVLGGKPLSVAYIAEQVGESVRSIRYHLDRLAKHGYIRRILTPGLASGYAVSRAKKFHIVRSGAGPSQPRSSQRTRQPSAATAGPSETCMTPRQETVTASAESGDTSGKDLPLYKEYETETKQGQDSRPLPPENTAAGDSRRRDFIEDLKAYWDHKNPQVKFTLNGAAARNLDLWLRQHPEMDRARFRRCLQSRAASPGLNHAAAIHTWISRVHEYLAGPLDRYWQPATHRTGNHGHDKAQQRAAAITGNIGAALERRRARRMAGTASGDAPEHVPEPAAHGGSERGVPC